MYSEQGIIPTWMSKLGPFLGAILFFAGLPIGLLNLGWHFIETQETTRQTAECFKVLDQKLFRLKREGNDANFINKRLNSMCGFLIEDGIATQTVEAALAKFRGERLPFVKFYFFDSKGEFIPFKDQTNEYRSSLKRMFSAICEYEITGKTDLLKQYRSTFHYFLGEGADPEFLFSEKGNLLKVSLNGKPGYFFWNSFEKVLEPGEESYRKNVKKLETAYLGGVIAFFEESEIPRNLALKRLIQEFNSGRGKNQRFGLLNLEDPATSFPALQTKTNRRIGLERLDKIVEKMHSQFKRNQEFSFGSLAILPYNAVQVVYGIDRSKAMATNQVKWLVKALSLFILILVLVWTYRVQISGEIFYIPIRRKLVGLFLYATGIPAAAFMLLGYQYVADRKQVLLQEQFLALSSFIETVDENFIGAKQTLQKFFQRLVKSPAVKSLDQKAMQSMTARLQEYDLISHFNIVTKDGNFLFSTEAREKYRSIGSKFLPSLARKIFAKKFGDEGSSMKNRMADAMVDSFSDTVAEFLAGATSKQLLTTLIEETDKIHELVFGNVTNLIYCTFLPQLGKKEQVLLFIFELKRRLTSLYLSKIQRNNARQNEAAYPIRMVYMENWKPGRPRPSRYSKYPFFSEMFEKVRVSQTPHTAIEPMGGEPYLVAAAPMNQLSDYTVFALYPYRLIEARLREISLRIGIVAALSGLFAMFIGLKLSRQFLWPIRELAGGISAVEKRDFKHRVPRLDHDELGDLGKTFNHVIGNLEEMHVARVVQETLFPENRLSAGEYEIVGLSKSMNDLGGDYFDYFRIDDRYLVILVGDVTGHGVPAALLMAMAKSGVAMLPPAEAVQVSPTLRRLNQMVGNTVKKKRLMTFFYSVLDTKEHILLTGNAGHCFPCVFRADLQKAVQIECASFPLGARKLAEFKEIPIPLGPGDSFVLYTDGLVESKNPLGAVLGYQGFFNLVQEAGTLGGEAPAIHARILAGFEKFLGGEKLEDDLTLIVVSRRKA